MADKHQFNGKSLDEALNEAAKYFSVDKAFICYNTLTNTQGGFLAKIFSSKVQIEAWVETAKEDLQEAARKAVREAFGKSQQSIESPSPTSRGLTAKSKRPAANSAAKPQRDPGENYPRTFVEFKDPKLKSLLLEYNQLFFSSFSLSNENYSTEMDDNNVIIHVEDDFLEDMLTKSDKLSLAYEHVFKRIAQKKLGDISGRLTLDAGSSAEKREERLIGIAKSLAEKVRKTGKSAVLSSKSSQERRVIHLALDGFEGIGTRSIGMGDKRRLVIFSNEKTSSSDQKQKNNSKRPHPNSRKTRKNSTQKKNANASTTNEKRVNDQQ